MFEVTLDDDGRTTVKSAKKRIYDVLLSVDLQKVIRGEAHGLKRLWN